MNIDWSEVVADIVIYVAVVPVLYAIMPRFFSGYVWWVKTASSYIRKVLWYVVRD